jgi:hypothetical protein
MSGRNRAYRRRALAGLAIVLPAALCLVQCREPTQITLEITTDAQCADVRGTTIGVGKLVALENKPAVAETQACGANGRIGSLVVVPSGDRDEEVSIRVVTGVGKTPEACVADGFKGGCIVARRTIRYLPHTPLEMPIEMDVDCLDIPCGATETCYKGECVSPKLDPTKCEQGDCRPIQGDGGMPDSGADATVDAGSDADASIDASDSGVDASDAGSDASDSAAEADVTVSCTAPMAECDGDLSVQCETDTTSDAKNCGSCGHDCLGGTCTAGECGVVTVLSGTGGATRLAIDATHIYYIGYTNGEVRRIPKTGGTSELLATTSSAVRIAVDATYAYWTDFQGKQLLRVPKAGGTMQVLATGLGTAQAVRLTTDRAYVTDYTSQGRVGWVPKVGGTATWLVTNTPTPLDMALTPTYAYFTDTSNPSTVRRVPLDGGTVENFYPTDISLAIETDGKDLYFASAKNGKAAASIHRLTEAGSDTELVAGLELPAGLTVDQTYVYFTDLGIGNGKGSVGRIAIDGSDNGVSKQLSFGGWPRGIVNDSVAVYWADETGDTINMIVK